VYPINENTKEKEKFKKKKTDRKVGTVEKWE
jgi:hypothetical protein